LLLNLSGNLSAILQEVYDYIASITLPGLLL